MSGPIKAGAITGALSYLWMNRRSKRKAAKSEAAVFGEAWQEAMAALAAVIGVLWADAEMRAAAWEAVEDNLSGPALEQIREWWAQMEAANAHLETSDD